MLPPTAYTSNWQWIRQLILSVNCENQTGLGVPSLSRETALMSDNHEPQGKFQLRPPLICVALQKWLPFTGPWFPFWEKETWTPAFDDYCGIQKMLSSSDSLHFSVNSNTTPAEAFPGHPFSTASPESPNSLPISVYFTHYPTLTVGLVDQWLIICLSALGCTIQEGTDFVNLFAAVFWAPTSFATQKYSVNMCWMNCL